MVLNSNFNPFIEKIILQHEGLADWFSRNQDWMAYFGLDHVGCFHFENSPYVSYDICVLGRMAHASLSCLEDRFIKSDEEKAQLAAEAISLIYETEKEHLSEVGKMVYAIDLGLHEEEQTEIKKVRQNRNGIKNKRPGKGHRKH